DILREEIGQVLVAHGVAAVFDDDRLAGIAAEIGERGGERRRLARRVDAGERLLGHGGGTLPWRRRRRQSGEAGAERGDAASILGAGQMDLGMSRDMALQLALDRREPLAKLLLRQ